MAINANLNRALQPLPQEVRRAIIDEFSKLTQLCNNLEKRNRRLTKGQESQVRDLARKENQLKGTHSMSTWDIRSLIRVKGNTKMKCVDIVLQMNGELYIPEDSEVIIGE